MEDDKVQTWLTLRFGTMDKALAASNPGNWGMPSTGPKAEFTDEEIEVLKLYQYKYTA